MNIFQKKSEKIIGLFLEAWVNVSRKPIILTDKHKNKFWQYPGDRIANNYMRKSVTDSNNVIHYILNNVQINSTVVDIGAHLGSISTALWVKSGKSGKVISLEPDPQVFKRLVENLKLNDFEPKYTLNLAVSDKTEKRQLTCYPESNGWQTLGNPEFAKNKKHFEIEVKTIDFLELSKRYKLEEIDLVKIDAEGSELLILNSMHEYLKQKKVKEVVFEVNYLMLEGMNQTVESLFDFWNSLDYELWQLGDGELKPFAAQWYQNRVGDCLARRNP